VVYLDDIMIFSKTWKEHIVHLKKVLKILRKKKFLVKKKKCTFGKEKVRYLGFIVGKRQVTNCNTLGKTGKRIIPLGIEVVNAAFLSKCIAESITDVQVFF
jgi:Reverse transcriptase (RNA-dependent DNA polymerase)